MVKARSKRDAWGCLIAEGGNKNSQIKAILFPRQIRKFLIGTDDSKVHFNMVDDDVGTCFPTSCIISISSDLSHVDPVHAIFTWDASGGHRSSPYKVSGTGAHGLLVFYYYYTRA